MYVKHVRSKLVELGNAPFGDARGFVVLSVVRASHMTLTGPLLEACKIPIDDNVENH